MLDVSNSINPKGIAAFNPGLAAPADNLGSTAHIILQSELCCIHAPKHIRQVFEKSLVQFPLTPALSLGERENHSPLFSKICDWICRTYIRKNWNARSLSPLPKGEG